mmetsp:Transcript_5457/g.6698  ORF Transcript_5457/g.6698 Transcript_5457/m.6698 type:complete len:551 (-) Transcript_5457:243-1895(-)|eukprot:CAMPEP_0203639720 /NCGR_PEP_ID=MMETSP0088-20131115/5411_1 /ASSEMBLY_ACC=CAM_ASM_001087 /TAXON_ID=426623 /ORGANISM="Chaetoceros affinis, Strain CCMP159" /LENGTH=550 /DNA_ID=CAMNT_0050494701 /DNA_START=315 /DNA_END=1967 /DNA_ORIENTATION=-
MQKCSEDELEVARSDAQDDNTIDNKRSIEDDNNSDIQKSNHDSQRKVDVVEVGVETEAGAPNEVDDGQHVRDHEHDQHHDQEYHEQQQQPQEQENLEEIELGPPKQHLRFDNDFLNSRDLVAAEEEKEPNHCCRARTLCMILTLILIFLSGTAVGFAIFPRTQYYSLVVIVPLICATFASCLAVMCYISAREGDEVTDNVMIVIDPSTDLPPTEKKRKLKRKKKKGSKKETKGTSTDIDDLKDVDSKIDSSKSSTLDSTVATTSAGTDCCDYDDDDDDDEEQQGRCGEGNDNDEKGIMATTFPEFYHAIENTQKAFEDATDYIITRILRPATAICRPSTAIPRCSSADASHVPVGMGLAAGAGLGIGIAVIGQSRSRSGFIAEADSECCVDVYCLRDEYGAVNLSGTFKLFHNQNFDVFLKALKVPALLRRGALATRPIHKYTHEGKSFRVQIEGIIKGDTTFEIYGPPTISSMRHLKFLDHVSYTEDKGGIVVRKVLQNRPKNFSNKDFSEIIVTRELSKNGKKMLLTSVAIGGDGSVIANSLQTFLRV